MQGRGLVPSVVQDAIKNPASVSKGNTPGTTVYQNSQVKVIVNSSTGNVITAYPKTH